MGAFTISAYANIAMDFIKGLNKLYSKDYIMVKVDKLSKFAHFKVSGYGQCF